MSNTTPDARTIIDEMFGNEPGYYEMCAEERLTSQAGRALRKARRAAGLTLGKLARMAGVDKCVIAQLEQNAYDGHVVSMLARVAAAMNLRMEVQFVPIPEKSPADALHADKEATVL